MLLLALLQFSPADLSPPATLPPAAHQEPTGYTNTPPSPDGQWSIHDRNRPAPPFLEPPAGMFLAAPDDAEVLFNGTGLTGWTKGDGKTDATWKIGEGWMEVNGSGSIQTRAAMGSGHYHVEWATPKVVKGKSQGVGNSGVFLMSQFEIQVLDSYSSRTYADGQAGAMYGQFPPDANVCRAPGEWQSFDIFFEAPKWKDKKLISKAKVTVYHNGVRIHQNREYRGPSSHGSAKGYDQGKVEGPLRLQDHGNPVRFRNIWFRPDAKDTYPEARSSEKKFKTPEGFQTNLWASEPSLANPVVFYPGTDGRVYVAESYRQEYFGVPDNRSSPEFLPDDLRSQTVEDRAKMYLKHHPEYAQSWTWKQERITWLKDTDGDGHADVSRVFADGFNALLDGTGAGILVRGNQAWYTCIPNLWILEDTNGDGEVEKRESLHHGYGVRVALRGHDSHGLIMGPDGKLYFSIGDRGYNVTNQEGEVLADPGRGAVFRCNLDGSGLEIFAVGLRNPQELCFDDFGNLWTGDNNCDAGDLARLVYVVEGGDCGWRMNFQYLPDRGAWMPESWWKPPFEGQAAFVNAPIANVAAGPSGFAAYPGFGLSDEYRNSLFLADFRGGADYSGVLRLQTESEGAGFKLKTNDEFWWGILATDVDFLPDGRLMVSDWVESWTGVSKGRLWTGDFGADPTAGAKNAALLNSDFPAKSKTELAELLGHTDRRIRLEAQYALVDKQSHLEFRQAAAGKNPVSDPYLARMQRIHGIWGLAQLGVDFKILPLLKDRDSEIRAQVAKVLGNPDNQWAEKPLEGLLQDPSPRVQYFAAMSLGKLGPGSATPLIVLLEKNADEDRWIRHAASFALSKRANSQGLASLHAHPSESVRMGSVLALRHQHSPLLKKFLNDPNSLVAAEAARAIYDTDITAALPALAEGMRRFQNSTQLALGPKELDPAHIRRAIHAANRVGGTKEAEWLLDYVEFGNSTTPYRLEAIEVLRNWASPKEFDPVMNESRQYPQRPGGFFAERLAPFLITEELNAVARGRKVFFENPSAGCLRCHDMEGKRGEDVPEVGPDLTFVGERLNQEQLRKSILEPSAEISKGFEIKDADGNPSKLSAMPVIYDAVLKDTEVNDLVAYLDSRRKPERLLVFVNSFGFEHSVAKPGEHGLSLVETTFQRWAKEDPRLEVIVDRDPARFAKADGLKNIDAVFFYTTGEIPIGEDGKKNLLEFVRRGGAFIGSHCASDTFYQWADYGKMLGGYFNGHPWHEEVTLKIENHRHPATQHLEKNWVIKDEIYQFKNWDRQGLKVLVSVDTDSVDMTRKSINRKDADFGITWTRKEGKGRVFYTALGHRPDVWASETFQHHLLGGVFWATRRAD